MNEPQQQEFTDFVRAHWVELMQIATGVCGSRVDAEDLVQSALTSVFPRWSSIRPDQAVAYLRRSIVNAHISWWRRRREHEVLGVDVSERSGPDWAAATDDRLATLELLRQLSTRQRAVLLLRYISGLTPAEIAATLDIGESTVRSQTARALATLRARLDTTAAPAATLQAAPEQIVKRP